MSVKSISGCELSHCVFIFRARFIANNEKKSCGKNWSSDAHKNRFAQIYIAIQHAHTSAFQTNLIFYTTRSLRLPLSGIKCIYVSKLIAIRNYNIDSSFDQGIRRRWEKFITLSVSLKSSAHYRFQVISFHLFFSTNKSK